MSATIITSQLQQQPREKLPDSLSLYTHIPFCNTRCSYCAFNTYTGLDALIEPFVQALCREIAMVASTAEHITPAHTLYFGGGTPSLLEPQQVERIIKTCRSSFSLRDDAEITLEVNPGTIDLPKMQAYRAVGINRVSIGVQSAHESELEMFGRKHTFQDAADAFQLARAAGFDNISIDLIYGAPTQTREGWCKTLDTVLAWQPDHISMYSLTLESQTLLEREVKNGVLQALDPDLAADMYDDARAYMSRTGLIQYEISNWSTPGRASRHNCQYWLNEPFLGFGPGAHGAAMGLRYWNIKPVHEYIRQIEHGSAIPYPFSSAMADYETIDRQTSMAETVILGLRLVQEGLDCAAFEQRFGQHIEEVYGDQIQHFERIGLLETRGDRLYLTERAYLISNRVFVEFYPD
jgi:oxygen-independent coproporphyrinogen-3 oxidase